MDIITEIEIRIDKILDRHAINSISCKNLSNNLCVYYPIYFIKSSKSIVVDNIPRPNINLAGIKIF